MGYVGDIEGMFESVWEAWDGVIHSHTTNKGCWSIVVGVEGMVVTTIWGRWGCDESLLSNNGVFWWYRRYVWKRLRGLLADGYHVYFHWYWLLDVSWGRWWQERLRQSVWRVLFFVLQLTFYLLVWLYQEEDFMRPCHYEYHVIPWLGGATYASQRVL